MSKVYYITSDSELPEVDYTGVKKRTLKEIKKINPLLRFPNWMSQDEIDKIDENMEILYVDNESDLGALHVSFCEDILYEVEPYIKKEYVYNLSGDMDERCLIQLVEYLKENIHKEEIEIWSVWIGDEFPYLIPKRNLDLLNINQEYNNLKSFMDLEYCCIRIQGDTIYSIRTPK